MLFKNRYVPRFKGYFIVYGLSEIIDGIVSIIVGPFGYSCTIHSGFCEWNLRKDMESRINKP